MTRTVKVSNITIGKKEQIVLIAGPCVIEDEDITLSIAEYLKSVSDKLNVPLIFKASYDKANRTSIKSFRGPGIEEGLKILRQVKENFNVPVLTDAHSIEDVDKVASVVDVIQVPAFLCRQTDLILKIANAAKCINIKKGQFLSPWDMKHVIEKAEHTGNKNILVTERGTSFGYNRLIADMCSLPILSEFGYPVVFDVTHSLQNPGGLGDKSGGNRKYIPFLARAAVACGCDAVFMEVHPDPDKALSDAMNSLNLSDLPDILKQLKEINQSIN